MLKEREAEDMIREWCVDEGIFGKKIKDKNATWHLVLRYPENRPNPLNVLQPLDKEDMIVIGAGAKLAPAHASGVRKLSPREREELLWDLRFLLGNRPTTFALKHPNGMLEEFSNQTTIFFDGLNKDRFMSALSEVNKSMLLAVWYLQRRFGAPGKKGVEESVMYG